ncbi:MAG: 50S ribosomal protein L13 [Chloroflexota bacterium]
MERLIVQKTYYPKAGEITHKWVLIDANDKNLGRLATTVARLLLGKLKPQFTPGVDVGDFVIVVNAECIRVTGNKLDDKKYYHYSGYPSGLSEVTLRNMLAKHPQRVIRKAVWGMLPHNRFGRRLLGRLKVYAGPDHPHEAQTPEPLNI